MRKTINSRLPVTGEQWGRSSTLKALPYGGTMTSRSGTDDAAVPGYGARDAMSVVVAAAGGSMSTSRQY